MYVWAAQGGKKESVVLEADHVGPDVVACVHGPVE